MHFVLTLINMHLLYNKSGRSSL